MNSIYNVYYYIYFIIIIYGIIQKELLGLCVSVLNTTCIEHNSIQYSFQTALKQTRLRE